jgi:hypothetical protein
MAAVLTLESRDSVEAYRDEGDRGDIVDQLIHFDVLVLCARSTSPGPCENEGVPPYRVKLAAS